MSEAGIEAGIVAPGEYAPAGEAQGETATFGAEESDRVVGDDDHISQH